MEIRIAIQTTEPLTGAARTEREGPLPFQGWLELLHALFTLIGGEVDSAGGQPASAQDPPTKEGGRAGPAHERDADFGPRQA